MCPGRTGVIGNRVAPQITAALRCGCACGQTFHERAIFYPYVWPQSGSSDISQLASQGRAFECALVRSFKVVRWGTCRNTNPPVGQPEVRECCVFSPGAHAGVLVCPVFMEFHVPGVRPEPPLRVSAEKIYGSRMRRTPSRSSTLTPCSRLVCATARKPAIPHAIITRMPLPPAPAHSIDSDLRRPQAQPSQGWPRA